jgi:predicted HicB family RNase H-like nuclease
MTAFKPHTGLVVNFTLRIPEDLHDKPKALAATEDRSVNPELLYLVRRAVEEGERRSAQGA